MKDVQDKVAFITGAARGMGLGMARAFSAAGMKVMLGDIQKEALDTAVAELKSQGRDVAGIVVDVTDRDSVFAAAQATVDTFGKVHVFINNAGVGYGARFADSSEDNFRWLMDINFWGVVNGTRALLPLLTQAPRGHLVNVSSIFGMVGIPTQSAYNAAKFAVRGFSEALQAEYLGTALSVSCVHPGGIRTNIARSARTDGSASVANADERDKQFQQMAHTTPERAAEIILKGTARGKRRILVGWDACLIQQFIKLFPTSYHWVTARMAEAPQ